jgi:hypothetical protein
MTSGINVTSQKGIPLVGRLFFPWVVAIFGTFRFSHLLSMGAKRYVDIVKHDGKFEEMSSGTFWALLCGAVGCVGDQTTLRTGAQQYGVVSNQEAMYQAIQALA